MDNGSYVSLGKLVKKIIDYRGVTPAKRGSDWSDNGYRALSALNVKTRQLVAENKVKYVGESLYRKWMKDEVERGDILITSEAPFGEVYYWNSDEKIVLSQRLYCLRINKLYSSQYIFQYMTSSAFRAELHARATGSTVEGLRQPALLKCLVYIPRRNIQDRIAEILFAYDDLIEENNRKIAILQEQALETYKEWFVRFRFPSHETTKYKNGLPEGWIYTKLDKVIAVFYGKDHSKLFDGSIPVYGSGGIMRYAAGVLYDGESVLIPRKGSLNNIMWVNEPFWVVDTMFYTKALLPFVEKYLYYVLSSLDMTSYNTGSALPSMTTDILYHLRIIVPEKSMLGKFDRFISEIFTQCDLLKKQNDNIIHQRDLLLPRLMSGKLEVY